MRATTNAQGWQQGSSDGVHLAADGLSNREIGQQLYLSHRTIGTHLYGTFPKLGISARGELRAALSAGAAPPQR